MAVDDVYKLTLVQDYDGQVIQNSVYFRLLTALATISDVLGAGTNFKDQLRAIQYQGVTWVRYEARQVRGTGVVYDTTLCKRTGGSGGDLAAAGIVTGAITAGDGLPGVVAGVNSVRTGQIGRSRRGRYFLCGLTDASATLGVITPATLALIQSAFDSLTDLYAVGGSNTMIRWVVWSETIAFGCRPGTTHPHAPTRFAAPDPTTAATDVTAVLSQANLGTQRRRRVGVGI